MASSDQIERAMNAIIGGDAPMERALLRPRSMKQRALISMIFAALVVGAAPAAAQSTDAAADTSAAPGSNQAQLDPKWRLDVDLPAGGGGWWITPGNSLGDVHFVPAFAVAAWFTHESGHGAMLRATSLALVGYYGGDGAFGVEAAYQYAFVLHGDLRSGITIAPYGGVFVGTGVDGAGAGPLIGGNLSFRIWGFELGVDLSYRTLIAEAVTHGLATTLRLDFSFWGY